MTIDKRLVSSAGGVNEFLEFDLAAGTVGVRYEADITDAIERNKALAAESDGYGETREWRHKASIPDAVLFVWIKKYGVDPTAKGHEDLLRRLLDDPEWRYLRVDQKPPSRVFWTSANTFKPVAMPKPASSLILQ